MENKPKKLQLKKETMAVLNDPKMEKINGGGAPGQPGGTGYPGMPGEKSAFTCDFGSWNGNCGDGTNLICCHFGG